MNASLILWGILFSSFGLGYFLYGKKQSAPVPLICGLVLMAYPYFIANVYVLVGVGIVLAAAPFVIKI